jgi:2-dehydro-3-deoxyphosphogluconate aldolase / (4S)-4-hydroxy-2-oxoglutarate aldolase
VRLEDQQSDVVHVDGLVQHAVDAQCKGALGAQVMTAWRSGADLVKVFPCTQVGGHRYIQALTRPFPHVPLVAAGGITPLTAEKFIRAGATAIGVGARLMPRAAITRHEREWIPELTRRFVNVVKDAREQRG